MHLRWAQKLAVAACLTTLVSACIQTHTYTKTGTVTQATTMYMQVWVNGKLVCNSGDSQGIGTTDNTEFSAQNGDGKGYGCAPGYSVIFWEHGYKGKLHYWGKSLRRAHVSADLASGLLFSSPGPAC